MASSRATASYVSPTDSEYFVYKNNNYSYIFSKEHAHLIPKTVFQNNLLKAEYERSFNWKLDERTSLVIASPRNQVTNAFATSIPNSLTVFYSGGAPFLDRSAEDSWLRGLLNHETAHLYQMNVKNPVSSFYKSIFGSSSLSFPFIIPFTNPNILLPRFLIEGNATFNESRFGKGGRLYSGESRALFFNLLLNHKVTVNDLINIDSYEFPYGQTTYLIGAYFNLYLAETFGTDKLNQLFKAQAERWINPLLINKTFKAHFDQDFYSLFNQFVQHNLKKALKQKFNHKNRPLASTRSFTSMSRQKNTIYFLTTNKYDRPVLHSFHIPTQKLTSVPKSLRRGKVFLVDGQFATATNSLIHNNGIQTLFGLYDENHRSIRKDYLSHWVNDLSDKNDILSVHIPSSFDKAKLYLNKKFYTETSSPGIFDSEGNIYNFNQVGRTRHLLKNKKIIYSYDDYYGKVVDADKEAVYFIASTSYGSSLYEFRKGVVSRLMSSDTIVDAKKISDTEFLVSELNSGYYNYKILKSKSYRLKPKNTFYYFENEPAVDLYTNNAPVEKINFKDNTTNYNSLLQLRYDGLQLLHTTSESNSKSRAGFFFSDPLNYNRLAFELVGGSNNQKEFTLSYKNSKNRLSWGMIYAYENSDMNKVAANGTDTSENGAAFLLSYPLWKSGMWSAGLGWKISSKDEYKKERETIPSTTLHISRVESYSLSPSPENFILATIGHKNYASGASYSGQAQAIKSFNLLNFKHTLSLTGELLVAAANDLKLNSSTLLTSIDSKMINSGKLRYSTFLRTNLTHPKIPIGLLRLHPFARAHYYNYKVAQLTSTADLDKNYYETGIGVGFELLLLHLMRATIEVESTSSNNNQISKLSGRQLEARFSYKTNF